MKIKLLSSSWKNIVLTTNLLALTMATPLRVQGVLGNTLT